MEPGTPLPPSQGSSSSAPEEQQSSSNPSRVSRFLSLLPEMRTTLIFQDQSSPPPRGQRTTCRPWSWTCFSSRVFCL
ncbi:hypothetical protein RCL1_008587 [Eukaryota sp. TZLM3-RCL]